MSGQDQVQAVRQEIEDNGREASEVKATLAQAEQAGDLEKVRHLRTLLEHLDKARVSLHHLLLRDQQGGNGCLTPSYATCILAHALHDLDCFIVAHCFACCLSYISSSHSTNCSLRPNCGRLVSGQHTALQMLVSQFCGLPEVYTDDITARADKKSELNRTHRMHNQCMLTHQ